MQVFFSYGHDTHSELVQKLAAEIERLSKGKISVWIDSYRIARDSHWRDEITKGIVGSRSVIAFLSEYSAREESVCRDELSIALVSKNGMIKTILLEKRPPDGTFDPPSRLTEYQWGDMSDYPAVKAQGEEAFGRYITREAQKIIDMLDSDDVRKYHEEIKRLRRAYHLPEFDDWTRFDQLIGEELIGREWLFDKIRAWEDDKNGSKVMMLYGQPGAGKSMFTAHLQMRDPAVVAAFPCDCRHQQYSTTESIIINISYRLALRIPDYRSWVLAHLSDPSFDLGGDMLFYRLILQPLSTCNIDGNRSVMVIAVDALDEMQNDTFAKFISDNAEALRPYVRFLVTSRKTPEITERFTKYPSIDLDSEEQQGREDIEAYFISKLGAALAEYEDREKFINKLIDHSHLMFTYAECVCNNILADIKDGCFNMQEYPVPNGIGELYKQTLDRSFGEELGRYSTDDFKRRWREPLGMIQASPEPLPISTLKLLTDWQDDELNDFMHPLATLLTETDGRLQVFHRSFGEWLNDTKTGYKTSIESGLSALAEACYSVYKEAPEDMDEYMLLYTTRFLRESTKRSHRKAYEEVCGDNEYVKRIEDRANELFEHSSFAVALLLFQEYSKINEQLKECSPGNPEYLNDYLVSLKKIAYIYEAQNNLSNALRLYKESLEIAKELKDIYHENPDYLHNYSISIDCVATIFRKMNKISNALEYYLESLVICRYLKDAYPKDGYYLHDYVILLERIADIYEIQNNYPDALKLYLESLGISRRLKDANHKSIDFLYSYTISLNNVANIYEKQEDFSSALKFYIESAKFRKDICTSFPDKPRYLCGYSISLCHIGDIFLAQKEYLKAMKVFRESLEYGKELIGSYPENSDYSRRYTVTLQRIATTYEKIAIAYDRDGLLSPILNLYLEATEILKELKDSYPENVDYLCGYAKSLANIAWEYKFRHKTLDAIKLFNEALDIWKELKNLYPENPAYLQGYLGLLETLASIYEDRHNYMRVIKLYQDKLEIYRHLKDTYPEKPDHLLEYALMLERIAWIYGKINDIPNILKYRQESLEILKRLNIQHPEILKHTELLAVSLWNMWTVTKSENYYNDAIMIAKKYPDLPGCRIILEDVSQ